jgi:PAS domain S-box-containing protein
MADEKAERFEDQASFDELPDGDGVVVVSSDFRVMSANLPAEKILRRRLPKGALMDLSGVIAEPHRREAVAAFREAVERGLSTSGLLAETSDPPEAGSPATFTFSFDPLFGPTDEIIGVLITLTQKLVNGKTVPHEESLAYDSVFEQLAEGVFTINDRWRITAFNRRAQEITGYRLEEVMGQHCWDIFSSDLCQSNCPLKISMETGVVCMDQDVRILAKDGRQQSILVNASAIKNKRGLVIGAVETFRPVDSAKPPEMTHLNGHDPCMPIIGESPELMAVLRLLPDVAASDATVLIEGESGTGKELIAKSIHFQSPRARGPFVPVNCSAFAQTLLESELFGHVKGAFTGAVSSKVGRFELAKGGTLFLDEIAEINPETQVKLLRVIEEKVFERVGGNRSIPMDTRIIAATNKNLNEEVRRGHFRSDLFFRLRTVPLDLPPLRERSSDIPLLVNYFVSRFNRKYKKNVRGVDPRVLREFIRYPWPGNVRELEHALEYAFVFVKGPVITSSHLHGLLQDHPRSKKVLEGPASLTPFESEDEKLSIQKALKKSHGHRDAAAQMLSISRTSLWRKMKRHGLV